MCRCNRGVICCIAPTLRGNIERKNGFYFDHNQLNQNEILLQHTVLFESFRFFVKIIKLFQKSSH